MIRQTKLLDCTLRDGAYIVHSRFGEAAIKGMIYRLQEAGVDLIECGWLKNEPHEPGSTFFHVPSDLERYLTEKSQHTVYVAMIDWDRYDLDQLPVCDGKSVDAVRVVFPYEKYIEGVAVGQAVKEKGYQVFFQAANTVAYQESDLIALAQEVNRVQPVCLSIVDTFGVMYEEDLDRIASVLDRELDATIKIGFHSHNNQQLSFSLAMRFIQLFAHSSRGIIVDASLCGMGRGAGNANTELLANYLNRKKYGNYDMNILMDAIDMYMGYFQEHYFWGYSVPYFIAGMYGCHVNNIAYLMENHRTNALDMKNIIEALDPKDRTRYDYGLLEEKYIENQNRIVDDEEALHTLKRCFQNRTILLVAPGKSVDICKKDVQAYRKEQNPVVIGVNAIHPHYQYDYLFFINSIRYRYAQEVYPQQFQHTPKILLSNIKTQAEENECIINFNRVVKRGWEHFDNAVINCLRLLDKLHVQSVGIAGFDGFKQKYHESYADASLPALNPNNQWDALNEEIRDMFLDFQASKEHGFQIRFVTESMFDGS